MGVYNFLELGQICKDTKLILNTNIGQSCIKRWKARVLYVAQVFSDHWCWNLVTDSKTSFTDTDTQLQLISTDSKLLCNRNHESKYNYFAL